MPGLYLHAASRSVLCHKWPRGLRRSPDHIPPAALLIGILVSLFSLTGCDQPAPGPKRADDKAAHAQRYHPDIHGSGTADRIPTKTAATHPEADAQPTSTTSRPGPVGCPVLFVNGDTITVQEVLEPILEELTEKAKTLEPAGYLNLVRRLARKQLEFQVSTLVLYQEAKSTYPEKAIEAFDKEADRRIKEIINLRFQGIHARYEAYLKALDLSVADIKKRVQRQVMVQQHMRDKFRPLLREPPRRQLLTYYQSHLEEFTTPARAELFLIEIPLEAELGKPLNQAVATEVAEVRKRARAQLNRAREELASGVEFSAVAKTYGKGLKDRQGGAWGEISPDTLRGRWAKAGQVLFTLAQGQISDVIEGAESVFIVTCGRGTPARQTSFEEAQTQIIERVKDEQFNHLSEEHIRSLLDRATIRPTQEFSQAIEAAAPRPPPKQPAPDKQPGAEP